MPRGRYSTCSRGRRRVATVTATARLREFVKLHPEAEGVIQHVGLRTWDLLVIDVTGRWARDEFESEDDARHACGSLGIRCHDGWTEPRMTRRMNGADHWSTPEGQRRAR